MFTEWRKIINPFMDVQAIKPGISFSHYNTIAGSEMPPEG